MSDFRHHSKTMTLLGVLVCFLLAACSSGPTDAEIQQRIDEAVEEAATGSTQGESSAASVREAFDVYLTAALSTVEEALAEGVVRTPDPEQCALAEIGLDLSPNDPSAQQMWQLFCLETQAQGTVTDIEPEDIRATDSIVNPYEAEVHLSVAFDTSTANEGVIGSASVEWRLTFDYKDGEWVADTVEQRTDDEIAKAVEQVTGEKPPEWDTTDLTEHILNALFAASRS